MCPVAVILLAIGSAQGSVTTRIDLEGTTVLAVEDVKSITNKYIGREIFAEDIVALINELNRLYADKGFVSSGWSAISAGPFRCKYSARTMWKARIASQSVSFSTRVRSTTSS